MGKSSKGSVFEREFCKRLGLWWTQDLPEPRDDVFWRTPTSGARATSRRKRGRQTRNQYGDVMATDLVGQPLLDLVVFELKRGYNRVSCQDLLDCKNGQRGGGKGKNWFDWIDHCESVADHAGVPYWVLVVRRDSRSPLIAMPLDLHDRISDNGEEPQATIHLGMADAVFLTTLDQFFVKVHPDRILKTL